MPEAMSALAISRPSPRGTKTPLRVVVTTGPHDRLGSNPALRRAGHSRPVSSLWRTSPVGTPVNESLTPRASGSTHSAIRRAPQGREATLPPFAAPVSQARFRSTTKTLPKHHQSTTKPLPNHYRWNLAFPAVFSASAAAPSSRNPAPRRGRICRPRRAGSSPPPGRS